MAPHEEARISMTLEPESDSKALRQQPTRAVSNHTTGRANLQQEAAFNGSIHACACLWCPHSPHNMSALTNGRETQTERESERETKRDKEREGGVREKQNNMCPTL